MARIKHIALSTDDPSKTAEFYRKVFGLTELRREPADTGADGVWLSDGYIYFAILKYGGEDTPNLGEGASTVRGVHHIGFYVDDMDEACAAVEAAGGTDYPGTSKVNRKYKGPDGLGLDIRVRGWDEQGAEAAPPSHAGRTVPRRIRLNESRGQRPTSGILAGLAAVADSGTMLVSTELSTPTL